jgi:hypothetical protein
VKIGQIRDTIDCSGWMRNDLAGHTRDEFLRANVPERLVVMIAELALWRSRRGSRPTRSVATTRSRSETPLLWN